ncbi:MAG: hypothetical protein C0502_06360 [Opitutus sp.]|nr:hypothetical protein [Opitutus sp.]
MVGYLPQTENVEGDQPLFHTYVLQIISPNNVPAGSSLIISPQLVPTVMPDGVSAAQALNYVSLSPTSLTFTGPNQSQSVLVTCNFPIGMQAGDYAYAIQTPGWPAPAQDYYGFINARILPPRVTDVPSVTLNNPLDGAVYTWVVGGTPAQIDVQFSASAPVASPITSIDAKVGTNSVTLTTISGLGTGSVTAGGLFSTTTPGIYTVVASATNSEGTSSDSAEIRVVVQAGPPTVSIAQPAPSSTYTLPAAGSVSVPYSFSALSAYGGITSLTATLNGSPVSFSPSGIGSLTASGSGNFSLTTGGSYELVVTATDANGTSTASRSFTVVAAAPAPTVTISQPLNGATYTRVAGSGPTAIPFSFAGTAGNGYTITSLTGALNGNAITASIAGVGSASATGTGSLSISSPGTYTLTATAASGATTASTSVTFTVTQVQPPAPACSVNWLPPISLGKVQKGGQNVAIMFELDCGTEQGEDRDGDGDPDHYPGQRTKAKDKIDTSIVIAVSEVYSDGSTSAPQLFAYDSGYTIQGNDKYHLNFPTARGTHRYRIEVFQTPAGGSPRVIGTKEFATK